MKARVITNKERKNQLKILLSDNELATLREIASREGIPVSNLVRLLLNIAAEAYRKGYEGESL